MPLPMTVPNAHPTTLVTMQHTSLKHIDSISLNCGAFTRVTHFVHSLVHQANSAFHPFGVDK